VGLQPSESGKVVGEVGERQRCCGAGLPTVRITRMNRRFWAAKTCSTPERMRARLALSRTMWRGTGLPLAWGAGTRASGSGVPHLDVCRQAIVGVGADAARGVGGVEHRCELGAFMGRGIAGIDNAGNLVEMTACYAWKAVLETTHG